MTDREYHSGIFALSPGERAHPLWRRLEEHFAERLATLRAKNDDVNLTPDQTAKLRGHIACLKSIIDLGKEPPPRIE